MGKHRICECGHGRTVHCKRKMLGTGEIVYLACDKCLCNEFKDKELKPE